MKKKNVGIIIIFVVTLLWNNIGYSSDLFVKSHIRVPIEKSVNRLEDELSYNKRME